MRALPDIKSHIGLWFFLFTCKSHIRVIWNIKKYKPIKIYCTCSDQLKSTHIGVFQESIYFLLKIFYISLENRNKVKDKGLSKCDNWSINCCMIQSEYYQHFLYESAYEDLYPNGRLESKLEVFHHSKMLVRF